MPLVLVLVLVLVRMPRAGAGAGAWCLVVRPGTQRWPNCTPSSCWNNVNRADGVAVARLTCLRPYVSNRVPDRLPLSYIYICGQVRCR